MKTLKFLTVLLAFMGFFLNGCSDNSQSPVTPGDQIVSQQGSLKKHIYREFSGTMDPIEVTNPGTTKEVDGKTIIRGMHNRVLVSASFTNGGPDLYSGEGDLELNAIIDFAKGVGHWWGKLKLTPTAPEAAGGYWELVWYGKGTLGPTGWTLPLKKDSGPGKGGALTGLHVFLDNIITAPPDLSIWHGEFQGFIKSHGGHH